jgi:tetratricopeptide (TPR) repeat protein
MRIYILAGMVVWLACGNSRQTPRYQELVDIGQFDSALVLLEHDHDKTHKDATVQFYLGKAYYGKGDLEKAGVAFRASVAFDSTRFAAWYYLGLVCDRQEKYQTGYEVFAKALACFPELRQGHWRDRSVEYSKNRFYLDLQDPLLTELSLKALEYTLTTAPPKPSLVALKAEALWQQYLTRGGKDAKLVSSFQQALSELMTLAPDGPEVHYVQGLYYRKENREQAEAEWLQALAGDSTYAEALCRLGEMYITFGAPDKAQTAYEKAWAVRPGYFPAVIGRGVVSLKQYKFTEAVRQFEAAAALYPEAAVSHYNLGVAYENSTHIPQAIHAYRRAVAIAPRMANANYNLGRIYYFSDKLDQSKQHLQQAVAIDSLFYDAYIFMANVHLKRGENVQARAVLESVLKKDPANELAQQNLAKFR